ncbi:berberine bridge enzyme-like 21 [Senna tora]|uniref:Berberine bridge enzyme-like 21 n=1 Tax=Senna tora TaxID=362788 RepID=A0A834WIT5_9FABA|nr:berberine bridge enzyme-like 21 [Senna tora]
MAKSLIILLLLLLHVSASFADFSLYSHFLKCLTKHTNPSDQATISTILFAQSNVWYPSVLQNYIRNARFNTSSTPKPSLIITPLHESHVQSTIVCAKSIPIQIKIRSGGYDYEGISYVSDLRPFVVLNLFNLRNITVDIQNDVAVVQAGATLGKLYNQIWKSSKIHGFPAGVCPTVVVGGHLSGGGYGNMLRQYGLSVDNVIDARIVDRTLEQNATDLVVQWQEVAPHVDDRLFIRLLLRPVDSKIVKGQKTVRVSVVTLFLGGADELVTLLEKQFPTLGLKKENCNETTWIDLVLWWTNYPLGTKPETLLDRNLNSADFLKRKSDYVQNPISRDGLEWIWKRVIEVWSIGFVFNPYGGRMSEIPSDATPFPHWAGNLLKIQYSVHWEVPGSVAEKNYTTQARRLYSYMTPFVSKNPRSSFLNYRDLDIGINTFGENSYEEGEVYGLKYFNDNFERLVKVKSEVDPENFFRNEQSIPVPPKK